MSDQNLAMTFQLRSCALDLAIKAKAAKDDSKEVLARASEYLTFLVNGQPDQPAVVPQGAPVAPAAAEAAPARPVPPAASEAATAAPAAAQAPNPPDLPPQTASAVPPPVTKEQTIAALKALMSVDFAGAQEVLGKFQATQLAQIPQARWAEFVQACKGWKPKAAPAPSSAAAALLA